MPKKKTSTLSKTKKSTTTKKTASKKKTSSPISVPKKKTSRKQKKQGVQISIHKNESSLSQTQITPARKPQPSQHILDLKKHSVHKEIASHNEDRFVDSLKAKARHTFVETQFAWEKKTQQALRKLPQKGYTTPAIRTQEALQQKNTEVLSVFIEGQDLLQETLQRHAQPQKKQKTYTFPKLQIPTVAFSLPKLTLPRPNFTFTYILTPYARRAVATFVLASFVLVSPLLAHDYYQKLLNTKGQVLGVTYDGINHLKTSSTITQLEDYASAQEELLAARTSFEQAHSELTSLNPLVKAIIAVLPQDKEYATAQHLLTIAQLGSQLAYDIVAAFDNNDSGSLPEKVSQLLAILTEKENDLTAITSLLKDIDINALPQEYREQFSQVMGLLPMLETNVHALIQQSELILTLVGHEQMQRYLIVFQNNNELRPTGGFIGSYAEITVDEGEIISMHVPQGGSYDLQGSLDVNTQSPRPLSVVNPKFEFQDGNFFTHFPDSAEQLEWLYQHSGKATVDGVIAINAEFIQELLQITGPIWLEEYNQDITYENFVDVAQYEAEIGQDKENNTPKRLITTLTPKVVDRLMHLEDVSLSRLFKVLLKNLDTRNILVHFNDQSLQKAASAHRWTGELLTTQGDYLQLVTTNVAGGKSDAFIEDDIFVDTTIHDSGEVTQTVILTRKHTGSTDDPLGGVKHNDFLRVYVPLGATLLSAEGFEPLPQDVYRSNPDGEVIDLLKVWESSQTTVANGVWKYQERDKTVFAQWVQTDVGETQVVRLTYTLPFTVNASEKSRPTSWFELLAQEISPQTRSFDTYSLLVQKQSGKNARYSFKITTPQDSDYVWAYPSAMNISPSQFTLLDHALNEDMFIGIVLEK
jgi:hypothetical protein